MSVFFYLGKVKSFVFKAYFSLTWPHNNRSPVSGANLDPIYRDYENSKGGASQPSQKRKKNRITIPPRFAGFRVDRFARSNPNYFVRG